MSTNLKMHLKPSVQDVCQNLDSCIVHCRWYTVGKAVPKLNFGSLGGWLEGESRRSSLRKSPGGLLVTQADLRRRPGPGTQGTRRSVTECLATVTVTIRSEVSFQNGLEQ